MGMTRRVATTATAAALVLAMAGEARADGWVAPFIAFNFGGDAGGDFDFVDDGDFTFDQGDRNRIGFGVNAGFMGGGIFGAEIDVAYTSNFFGDAPGIEDNSLLTIMPALVVGIPFGGQSGGGFRPYAIAGIGMTRRNLDVDLESVDDFEFFDGNELAYSLGAGAMIYFADHIGIRAEYRYLRHFSVDELSFEDPEVNLDLGTFNFSRATLGVVFRF
jgi:opacity protein-like surface antigen